MKIGIFILLVVGLTLAVLLPGCKRQEDLKVKSSLEQSLDSANVLFLSSSAVKIVSRIRPEIIAEKDVNLKIRGLRILSSVMISSDKATEVELDSANAYLRQAESLALKTRDSIAWALCQIQVFRYENRRREKTFIKQKIGSKRVLLIALKVIERANLTDDLCVGYRTLARSLFIDKDAVTDVLEYELKSLQNNDSARYPVLRARICNDLAITYSGSFNQEEIAEKFTLRAIQIFKHSDDTLNYARTVSNLSVLRKSDPDKLECYRQALRILKSGSFPFDEARIIFEMAHVFQWSDHYDSALFYFHIGMKKLSEAPGNHQDEIRYQETSMAKSFAKAGQLKKAKRLMALDQPLDQLGVFVFDYVPELKGRIQAYEAIGDLKKLAEMQHRLLMLQDSMYSKEQLIEAGKVENGYNLKLKNEELKNLQTIGLLRATAANHEMGIRFLLISGVVITILGLVLVRILLTQKNNINRNLTRQNAIIEMQHLNLERSFQDLQRAQAHVLNSEKMVMLGQFTAGIAHELNNPLNFISGGISVFEEAAEEIGLARKEFQILHDIRVGIDQAMHIVGSLRVFFAPESAPGFFAHADIAECMTASLLVLQSKIRHHKIRIESNVPAFVVVGHSSQLCQVFINLLDNAIHAVKGLPEERKIIEILARRDSSRVLIDFKDHGYGIPESVQAKLFQPFYTSNLFEHRKGLGLFTSETILRKLNGSISSVSHAQEGTTFIVQLNVPE